jgi:tRNA (mo5U34)-methyltransferase
MDDLDRPAMAFFPGAELNNDPTNWWAPNIECVKGMLRDLGFTQIDVAENPNPAMHHDGIRGRHVFTARRT